VDSIENAEEFFSLREEIRLLKKSIEDLYLSLNRSTNHVNEVKTIDNREYLHIPKSYIGPDRILRTNLTMNSGIMEWHIRKLKKELEENGIESGMTLEMAVDWLTASRMFTEEEIADFIGSFEK
tara:strand:+ start:326 stop:697 length:372 start_codon:yes stop_codon:yes gene_type:complete